MHRGSKRPQSETVLPKSILITLSIVTVFLLGMAIAKHTSMKTNQAALGVTASGVHSIPIAKAANMLPGVPVLDRDAATFATVTQTIDNAPDCFPIHIRDSQQVGILYLYCSENAWHTDAQPTQITENFSASEGIARRFNFWRRIYSLWGADNYVLHLSAWPEVVLEAYDGSRLAISNDVRKEKKIKRIAKTQRAHYKRLFSKMHRYRNSPERFTPAMQRLAKMMEHINDKRKYWVAARTLRLQRGQRDFIATGLTTATRYLPAIEKEFEAQGIPVELSRIAFVESSFNLKAKSKVGASGVYQIMPATGRQYLKVWRNIDERNDPIKASRAAAKLFKLNMKVLGEWPLAITAYNHGVGGVKKAMRRTGSKDIVYIIDRYYGRAFKFASKNFYAGFLGALATVNNADAIFPEVRSLPPLAYREVRLKYSTSMKTVRRKYEMSNQTIGDFNPDISKRFIRAGGVLPKGYVLKVPSISTTSESDLSLTNHGTPNS